MAVNSNYTKNLFADELIKMVGSTPLRKVRINELCRRCGADRRTFYYHFIDKYDLVAWIYMRDYEEALGAEEGKYTEQHVVNLIRKLDRHRNFYEVAYTDTSQNSILKYMFQYYYDLGGGLLMEKYGIDKLTPEMDYAVRSQFYAVYGITLDWFRHNVDYTIEEFAHLQYKYMPPLLKEAYDISD